MTSMQLLPALHAGPSCPIAGTPTGSACMPGSKPAELLKSPLAKFDNISATHPEGSSDSQGTAVDGPAAAAAEAAEVASLPRPNLAVSTAAAAAAAAQARPVAQPAAWLMGLFSTDLFSPCPRHPSLRKNECNQYCLACTHTQPRGMCKYCLGEHVGCTGRTWQIRKYMYQTCIHVEDIQPFYDVSGVQAYCINSKRAVLIHPKQMAPGMACPAFENTCAGCAKPLRNDCTYCSLRCKVDVHYGLQPATPRVHAAIPMPGAGRMAATVQHVLPAAAAAAMMVSVPPVAAARLAAAAAAAASGAAVHGLPNKRIAALRALQPANRLPASTDSEVSGRSSASHCSLGSRKRRKLDVPQRSFLV